MSESRADLLRPYAVASPRRYAAALATATNEITRRAPAPRDLPFFGLDHPHGTRARRLDRLSELGIFRVYERVLDLGAGLGGPARWLARRRGCSVVSFDRSVERAAASRLLVRRAHLQGSVRVSVAALDRLPVASHAFTHAWSVEALQPEIDKPAVVAELFRAVRPGGHVALQEWVR
ncbi:MAG TPA: class I SAM-dependent methyltransferase, partial [Candidatus Binatia bacterium]|nr:class I SAM-dependent methyltransferase [Candidatus Binatia bacterium]